MLRWLPRERVPDRARSARGEARARSAAVQARARDRTAPPSSRRLVAGGAGTRHARLGGAGAARVLVDDVLLHIDASSPSTGSACPTVALIDVEHLGQAVTILVERCVCTHACLP